MGVVSDFLPFIDKNGILFFTEYFTISSVFGIIVIMKYVVYY